MRRPISQKEAICPDLCSPTPAGQRGPGSPEHPPGLGSGTPRLVSGQASPVSGTLTGGCKSYGGASQVHSVHPWPRPLRVLGPAVSSGSRPHWSYRLLLLPKRRPSFPQPVSSCSLLPTRKWPAVSALLCPPRVPSVGCWLS